MPVHLYMLMILVSSAALIIGLIIGFYKTKSDLSEQYISKKDCEGCAMKVEIANLVEKVGAATIKLEEGSKIFTDLLVANQKVTGEIEGIHRSLKEICRRRNVADKNI